jgi:hypothetical protein
MEIKKEEKAAEEYFWEDVISLSNKSIYKKRTS